MTRRLSLALVAAAGLLAAPSAAHAAPTAVSIQLDGALATQAQALQALEQRGMRGTLYVNSGRVGGFRRLTWPQIQAAAAAGHEVGGFSVQHTSYTTLTQEQVREDACADRAAILTRGIGVSSFAYPFGLPSTASAPAIESAVRSCGYDNARTTTVPDEFAESIPPVDPMATRAFQWDDTHTLADLKAAVTNAEANGGGWIQYAFQEICDGCEPRWQIPPATFTAFLDWLADRRARGTVVATPRQVLQAGGTPTADPTAAPPPASAVGFVVPGQPTAQGTTPVPGAKTVRRSRPAILSVRLLRKRIARNWTLRLRLRVTRDTTVRVVAAKQKVRRSRTGKRYKAWVRTARSVTVQADRGWNTRRFKARLLRLGTGPYRLQVQATDATGLRSKSRFMRIRVVR